MAQHTSENELIFFSKYVIGGVQNYYYNIISNDPFNEFEKKWIFTSYRHDTNARLPVSYDCCTEEVFDYSDDESMYEIARRLNRLISDKPGVIMTNAFTELATLDIYRKKNKTVFFVCHDEDYLKTAKEFEFLIDVFIAHNEFFFHELKRLFPARTGDIHYLPYGVKLSGYKRIENKAQPLRIAIIARLQESKGIFDLPLIDALLAEKNIRVQWSVIGAGPGKERLMELVAERDNFSFLSPETTEGVLNAASANDIFILPSRLDGMPVALLEAMSVGLVPLISEFNPGIKALVTEQEGYIVPVGDNAAFAEKIAQLHADRSLLEALSAASYDKIRQHYSSEKRALPYYGLFRKFKELKKPSRPSTNMYGGLIHRLRVPKGLRKAIKKVIGILHKNKQA